MIHKDVAPLVLFAIILVIFLVRIKGTGSGEDLVHSDAGGKKTFRALIVANLIIFVPSILILLWLFIRWPSSASPNDAAGWAGFATALMAFPFILVSYIMAIINVMAMHKFMLEEQHTETGTNIATVVLQLSIIYIIFWTVVLGIPLLATLC